MRSIALFAASAALVWGGLAWSQPLPKDDPKGGKDAKETPAATLTRTKLLKAKVTANFTDVRLGEVLKEFAAQVDMRAEAPVMWIYGSGFPFAQKVSYSCKDQPLEDALDELFTKLGTPGFVVVSKDGDKHDGWVRLTNTGERGYEKGMEPKATAEDETAAGERLALAKKLIADGKPDQARPVLVLITKKYPLATAAREAKQLLAKLGK